MPHNQHTALLAIDLHKLVSSRRITRRHSIMRITLRAQGLQLIVGDDHGCSPKSKLIGLATIVFFDGNSIDRIIVLTSRSVVQKMHPRFFCKLSQNNQDFFRSQ